MLIKHLNKDYKYLPVMQFYFYTGHNLVFFKKIDGVLHPKFLQSQYGKYILCN
jgi:hypothetical protein